jgi:hypothetical protein
MHACNNTKPVCTVHYLGLSTGAETRHQELLHMMPKCDFKPQPYNVSRRNFAAFCLLPLINRRPIYFQQVERCACCANCLWPMELAVRPKGSDFPADCTCCRVKTDFHAARCASCITSSRLDCISLLSVCILQ